MSYSYSLTQKYDSTFVERVVFNIIKQGPIPKHCAIIMDGNRRFAKRFLSGCLATGYKMGYTVFPRAVHMLLDCGITEMTVYIFSQDNYKRAPEEVESIMDVVLSALLQFEREIDYIDKRGICFEAIGKWEDIPYPGLTEAFARLMLKTKGNNKFKINMAMGYSGRQEILDSANTILQALEDGRIHQDDMNETLVQNILTLKGTNPVDLLIRTSGDTRLSDFLLWSTNDETCLEFIGVTWPEFKLGHFIKAILSYQKHFMLSKAKCTTSWGNQHSRITTFIEQYKREKWENVEALCNL